MMGEEMKEAVHGAVHGAVYGAVHGEDKTRARELRTRVLEVKSRSSLFDTLFAAPWNSFDTGFKGLYMLLLYLITVGIGIEALGDLARSGNLFEPRLLMRLVFEWQYVLGYWTGMLVYSYSYFES